MGGVDQDESVMDMNKRIVAVSAGAAVVAAIAIGGAAVASNGGADPDEVSLSSAEGKDASAAALKETGGGKANSVERDDEDNAVWEVEVTRKNGSTVDVRLDKDYKVVAVEGDGEADDEGKDDKDDAADEGKDDKDDVGDEGKDDKDDVGDDESEADDKEGPGAADDDSDVGDDNSDKD